MHPTAPPTRRTGERTAKADLPNHAHTAHRRGGRVPCGGEVGCHENARGGFHSSHNMIAAITIGCSQHRALSNATHRRAHSQADLPNHAHGERGESPVRRRGRLVAMQCRRHAGGSHKHGRCHRSHVQSPPFPHPPHTARSGQRAYIATNGAPPPYPM